MATAAIVVAPIVMASRAWLPPPANPEPQKRSTNSIANDQYDLGRGYYRKTGDMIVAGNYYKAALAADPDFGLPKAGLATTLCYGGRDAFEYVFPTLSQGVAIAQSALKRDANLSGAHLALAWNAYVHEWNWKKAKEHFEKAIRCAPLNPEPHEWYGLFLSGIGKTNEAIRHLQVADDIAGSDAAVNGWYGQVLFSSRRYAEAIHKLQKAAAMPDKQDESRHLTWMLLWIDRTDEAIEKWVDSFYGTKDAWASDLKRVLHEQGQRAFWNKRLEGLRSRTSDPLILAEASSMAGHVNEALTFLEQAYREHHDFLGANLKNAPEWDILRDQPRFNQLLTKMKYPE